jgi:hypothetical protein
MLKDIIQVRPLNDFHLHVRFEDGVEGVIDVANLISFHGVFESLKDPAEFARVRVNPELGSIEWPGGADLDPDVLYDLVAASTKARA